LHLAYGTQKKGNRDIFEKAASGLGEETELVNSKDPETLDDWSPDGKYILYRTGANTNAIQALPLFGDRKPIKVIESEFNKAGARLSPDGKWLTYYAMESGASQVYVVSFPKPEQKRQISTEGGVQPRWSQDGREIYFLSPIGKMMAVDVITAPTLSSGAAHSLFDTGISNASFDGMQYAVTGDGKRFLLFKEIPADPAAPPPVARPLSVIVNWTAALKDRKQ
jgi:Tol biopolymer transport system component